MQEWDDAFLSLFPNRYDFIYAPYPKLGESPQWQTETRYPLSDRLIQQGKQLFGVRPGSTTNYFLLDIDIGSQYHPNTDPFAIAKILEALEPLGISTHITCTSSYSNGLHLYFPLQKTIKSWQLANAVSYLLEHSGFKLSPGQLELFPNRRTYPGDRTLSLFSAHRLPLQIGSYLLNSDFEPVWSCQSLFVRQWQYCQTQNKVDQKQLAAILRQVQRQYYYQLSGRAQKFLDDLNTEIEAGWTGFGQTNRLLGRITMRSYIFHHVLTNEPPLDGKRLIENVLQIATSLPGYKEWCRHQHEIESRIEEWARCIESSHYFHYGYSKGKYKSLSEQPKETSWNQQKSEDTRKKIQAAIADLLEKNQLPSQTTERFKILTSYGIGGGSLYRHRDLWHPEDLEKHQTDQIEAEKLDVKEKALSPSLLCADDGNSPESKLYSLFVFDFGLDQVRNSAEYRLFGPELVNFSVWNICLWMMYLEFW